MYVSCRSDSVTRTGSCNHRNPLNHRNAFTMIELLIVIVIIAILTGLLLPAVMGAIRTANNAAVTAEISTLSQALAQFQSQYGSYPPSRVILCESGYFNTSNPAGNGWPASSAPLAGGPNQSDITVGQLASRTVSYMRRFWPRVQISTTQPIPVASMPSPGYYDFNGNGIQDVSPYILQGHECLVFFLGGIPYYDQATGKYAMVGFSKNPINPFQAYTANSNTSPPMFSFKSSQLALDPTRISPCGIPGYMDSLGNQLNPGISMNFYAYFSGYGSNAYDPNDVNFTETDPAGAVSPITLQIDTTMPEYSSSGSLTTDINGNMIAVSPSPNPYTSGLTEGKAGVVGYQKGQTFQIISSGYDGVYGIGGYWAGSKAGDSLPLDKINAPSVYNSSDGGLRRVEADNLSNFTQGKLQ